MASADSYNEYRDLRQFIRWNAFSAVPMALFTLGMAFAANSLSVLTASLDTVTTLIVNLVNLLVIGVIMRQNVFKYPYGTGKLENFVGVFYGCCITPVSIAILVAAFNRYRHPPQAVNLGLSQLAILVNLVRTVILYFLIRRVSRRYPGRSPLTEASHLDYYTSMIYEATILFCLFLGWLASVLETRQAGVVADMAIASLVALYVLVNGVKLIYRNFHSLICLPLPEPDQYKILNALAQEFKEYAGIGNIYTHKSGRQHIVQIELYFPGGETVESIERLRLRLERRLGEQFRELKFHLIPLCAEPGSALPPASGEDVRTL